MNLSARWADRADRAPTLPIQFRREVGPDFEVSCRGIFSTLFDQQGRPEFDYSDDWTELI